MMLGLGLEGKPMCPGRGVASISIIEIASPAELLGKISGGVSDALTSAVCDGNDSSVVEGIGGRGGPAGLVVSSGPDVTLPRLLVRII